MSVDAPKTKICPICDTNELNLPDGVLWTPAGAACSDECASKVNQSVVEGHNVQRPDEPSPAFIPWQGDDPTREYYDARLDPNSDEFDEEYAAGEDL